ncbi:hypothetical protein [Garciella nitratireducens]|uniref:hypothetical protein n=1 Tax=Garciella nitratireducens TaxID=218205 RepID=UPI001BD29825|nr:hypothetical protein [Garciella nitratireducens]
MKKEELKELENLVNTFLTYSNEWLKNGVINETMYENIRKEKLKFIENLSINEKNCCESN